MKDDRRSDISESCLSATPKRTTGRRASPLCLSALLVLLIPGATAPAAPVTSPTPCTAATYLALLETGVYPRGRTDDLRAQYTEVFPANANAFPADILQAHLELLLTPRDLTVPTRPTRRPSPVPFYGITGTPARAITSLSACAAGSGTSGGGSCPSGSFDTLQIVLAPGGSGDAIDK